MVDLTKRRLFSRKTLPQKAVRLPWANHEQFTELCTRCNKCIDACETKIIQVADGGFPAVNFKLGECTFCYQCADVCPEMLFKPEITKPWHITAEINGQCLANKSVECRSCKDMCDPMAISFQLEIGKVAQPKIDIESCTGCGACVANCPTMAINII